jgi:hypothetical protein
VRTENRFRAVLQQAYDFGPDFPRHDLLRDISAALRTGHREESQPRWFVGALAVALGVAIVVALVAVPRIQHAMPPQPGAPVPATGEAGVAAVLANNHVVYIPPNATKPAWDTAVAPPANLAANQSHAALGHRIAVSPDRSRIYAIAARDFVGGDHLVVLEAASGRIDRDVQLPSPAGTGRYGALTIGPSGDVWVVGAIGKRIEVVRLNHDTGAISSWSGRDMTHWSTKGPVSGDFYVYQVQVSADERRVYYSYTGGLLPSAGLDWVDITGSTATSCQPVAADKACIPGLAGFVVTGFGIFITSAFDQPSGAIDQYAPDARQIRHIELGLLPGFLDDLEVAPDARRLVYFGSCGYSGGMGQFDFATGKPSVVVSAKSNYTRSADKPCGESWAFTSATQIALAHVGALLPSADAAGQIDYVDAASGSVTRSVTVSAEPVSLAVANGRLPVLAPPLVAPTPCPSRMSEKSRSTPAPNGSVWIACLGTSSPPTAAPSPHP